LWRHPCPGCTIDMEGAPVVINTDPSAEPADAGSNHRLLLEVEDLTKSFGAVQALRGASLTCRSGEVTAIVGDNGAGKSTLIKCLTGIEHPTSGTVRFRGQPVSLHSPDNARSLGIETVYQDLALVDDLTVWQNLFLNREIYRGIGPLRLLNKRAMVAAAQRTIEDLQVSVPSVRATVRRLSGGQRQAVAISRAVNWGSALVIMDEPTAALGLRETAAVEALIRRLQERQVTVLIISHNLEQVFRVCDQVWVMRQGRVVAGMRTADTTSDQVVALITGSEKGAA
jgi:D-xylose transport system ATP-binding protein